MATLCDKCLVKMKKALNLWVERMNRKLCVPNGSKALHQKVLILSQGSPEVSDHFNITLITVHCYTYSISLCCY